MKPLRPLADWRMKIPLSRVRGAPWQPRYAHTKPGCRTEGSKAAKALRRALWVASSAGGCSPKSLRRCAAFVGTVVTAPPPFAQFQTWFSLTCIYAYYTAMSDLQIVPFCRTGGQLFGRPAPQLRGFWNDGCKPRNPCAESFSAVSVPVWATFRHGIESPVRGAAVKF